jgi:Fur family ferric uptake transcriptional regulator
LTRREREGHGEDVQTTEREHAKQRFLDFLAGKGFRVTTQRRAIVEAVFATNEHFTADQLHEWARQRDPSVSRATVYRALPLLVESGLVREMDFGGDRKIYDPNYAVHPEHSHLVCADCGRIIEFSSEQIARLQRQISREFGFTVISQRVQIIGRCEQLRRTGHCPHRAGGAEKE